MIIQSVKIRPVSYFLKRPFVTAAGKKLVTHNVRVWVCLANRLRGLGEASTSLAMAEESAGILEKAFRRMAVVLPGRDIGDYPILIRACWDLESRHPAAVAAIECALLDAYAQALGKPLWRLWGRRCRPIETDITLSVAEPETLIPQAREAARRGFRRFKIKLGRGSPRKNTDRVAAVSRAVPGARLVADGNQGMTLAQALEFAVGLQSRSLRIEFLEQPFPKDDMAAMRMFRRRCRLALVADEAVQTANDARRLFTSGAADGVNIKIAKSGLLGSLEIMEIAKKFKKTLSIGCMEESRRGLAASVHLACGTGVFDWVDLDSAFLLRDGSRAGFRNSGPYLSVEGIERGAGVA